MPNGFIIIAAVIAILLVVGFFQITTERERYRWGHTIGGLFVIALVVVTILTYVSIAAQ